MEQKKDHEMELMEDEFIDMEVTSTSSPRFCYSKEFEFQMGNASQEKEAATCPADELFYKGKLLPLHLPRRMQMVEKLVHGTSIALDLDNEVKGSFGDQHQYRNPLFGSSTAPCTNSNTPLDQSCNISPAESCRASSELNPDEYFFDWSTEISSLIARESHLHGQHCHRFHTKKSWSRKIKQSILGQKLKASRSYLKTLFKKSVCSNEACGKATCNGESGCVFKAKECVSKYIQVTKKRPVGSSVSVPNEKFTISSLLLKNSNKDMADDGQRKSFSGAINWSSGTKDSSTSTSSGSGSSSSSSCSSSSNTSSFAFNFNGFYELKLLKRSSSANSELESSVEGAIAHCKQSQKMFDSRKNAQGYGTSAMSASKVSVPEGQHAAGVTVSGR